MIVSTNKFLQKMLRLKLILIFLVFLFQCSQKTEIRSLEVQNNTLLQTQDSQNNNSIKFNEMDHSKEKINVENWIKTTSKEFYLQNLKGGKLSSDEAEIRIWSEQTQGTILNCLVLYKKTENWQANLYSIRVIGELGEYEKTPQGKNLVNKKTLSVPKSGWRNVINYLTQKGVKIPLTYSWDMQNTLVVEDEGSITLELKQGVNYDLVSYGELTESLDGKSVVNVCNYLENEFQIKIGCGY